MTSSINRSMSASGGSFDLNKSKSSTGSGQTGRFRWPSNWQFIMGTVCYTVTYNSYNTFGSSINDKNCIWQYMLGSILVGLPILYTQTFLGQFCQMGMLNFRYLMPMCRGLMYIFLACVVMKTIRTGYVLTDSILYFLMCFQNTLPWKVCPEDYKHICEANNGTTDQPHSAFVFWKYIYAGNPTMDMNFDFTPPEMSQIISFCLQWGIMFVLTAISYANHRKISRLLFYIHLTGLLMLVVSAYSSIGNHAGIYELLFSQFHQLADIHKWLRTLRAIIADLSLAELYNMYAGAHLRSSAPSATLSVCCIFVIGFCNFLASTLTNICYFIIRRHTGLLIDITTPHELGIGVGHILVVIPQGLSYLTLPQGWCAVFFWSCICLVVSNQILHLLSIQMTIVDMYPNFDKYKTYLIGGCCLCSCAIGACLLPRGMHMISQYALENIVDNLMCFCVSLWAITIYWVYGVGRLSDDIQFTKGVQPTKFWKILWYTLPIGFLFLICIYLYVLGHWDFYYMLMNVSITGCTLLPFFIFIFIEIFTSLKKRNLLGVFQPHPKWGPPEVDERLYRKFFNPRTETKYQAHKMICYHKCLINSEILADAIKKEDALRTEFFKLKYPEKYIVQETPESQESSISSL